MGGFSVERAREAFDIGDDCSIIAVVALGYYGNKEDLSPELLQKERPGLRKPTQEILHLKGRMPARKEH
jgi:hypothetical protein